MGVRENPTTTDVSAAAEVAARHRADGIIGLGGGSAMDCAKGANFLATNGGRMEDYQGRGIAGCLLRHLSRVARASGIATFEADVLADNKAMRAVFERSGWPMRTRREGDAVHVELTLPQEAA